MKVYLFVLFACVMAVTCALHAQPFSASLFDTSYHLADTCNGEPLHDGPMVQIMWDYNSDGPDMCDIPALICEHPPDCEPGTVNFNGFPLNGEMEGSGAGFFYQWDPMFSSYGDLPSPNRFYLLLYRSDNMCFYSEVFSPQSSASDINLSSWTCSPFITGETFPPPPPNNFRASDDEAEWPVQLTWNPGIPDSIYLCLLYRNGMLLDSTLDNTYWDSTAVPHTRYLYGARGTRYDCRYAMGFSSMSEDSGGQYPLAIETPLEVPGDFGMSVYPNPFNAVARIELNLVSTEDVRVGIFDLAGREVAELFNGRIDGGKHTLMFEARNLPSGIYFCRATMESSVMMRKLVLLK